MKNMHKVDLRRLVLFFLILFWVVVYFAAASKLYAEVPSHIQVAHLECIVDKLAYKGTDLNTSNGVLISVIAVECEKIIGWKK